MALIIDEWMFDGPAIISKSYHAKKLRKFGSSETSTGSPRSPQKEKTF